MLLNKENIIKDKLLDFAQPFDDAYWENFLCKLNQVKPLPGGALYHFPMIDDLFDSNFESRQGLNQSNSLESENNDEILPPFSVL